jgi:hypothetical protein
VVCRLYDFSVLNRSPSEWAQVCRNQAALTSNKETRECLLKMAAEYEAKAAVSAPSLSSLFYDEAQGTFSEGFVFRPGIEATMNGERNYGLGHWDCDLSNKDKLTWSDEVYELFGIAPGTPLDREWVVGRYDSSSRSTLERIRSPAVKHGVGFILDAEITPDRGRPRWMRIFALPISDQQGETIRLTGVKRAL